MNPAQALHDLGQSIWVDNNPRDLLDGGTLERCVDELSVRELRPNPTIFDHALKKSRDCGAAIGWKIEEVKFGEALFLALAQKDLGRAADLFGPVHERAAAVDAGDGRVRGGPRPLRRCGRGRRCPRFARPGREEQMTRAEERHG